VPMLTRMRESMNVNVLGRERGRCVASRLSPAPMNGAIDRGSWRGSGFVLALFLVALGLSVAGCGGSAKKQVKVNRAPAVGVSVSRLTSLSASLGHPIYWAGAEHGNTYELSRTKDGLVYIRYLPKGAKVGDPKPNYLAVGTYPQANAFAVLKATAKKQRVATMSLRGGGLAFVDKSHPTSVYLAYPGSAYQIEVYDPSPARARRLAVSGKVVPLGIAAAGHAAARAVTVADLKALAFKVGHPIMWAGPEAATTYELTQTTDGRIYVRYLPAGVKVGDQRPNYLTVGTYPQSSALAVLKASAAKSKAETIKLAGGALALIDTTKPTSVYLARPGDAFQVEVYDPSASTARQLVTAGRIVPVA
jgi:hypothetical protein